MLGNYALVEGAISAGCDFFAGYPITPANEISERMSQRLPLVGGKFVQGEDELFSIFALPGASLAGAKVMTATASASSAFHHTAPPSQAAAPVPAITGAIALGRVRGRAPSIHCARLAFCDMGTILTRGRNALCSE